MRAILIFNRERCLACRACELACSVAHSSSERLETAIAEELPPKRRVTMAAGKDGIDALRCEQCAEPLCAFSCKSGALHRDPISGWIALEESRCVGCFMCMMVCPHGIRPDPATDRVVRCDVCLGREIPACVAACPTGALATQAPPDRPAPGEFKGHVVVVGSSAAGIAACEVRARARPRLLHHAGHGGRLPAVFPPAALLCPSRPHRPPRDLLARGRSECPGVAQGGACFSLPIFAFRRRHPTPLRPPHRGHRRPRRHAFHSRRGPRRRPRPPQPRRPRRDRKSRPRLAAVRWCWVAATSVSRPARRCSPAG